MAEGIATFPRLEGQPAIAQLESGRLVVPGHRPAGMEAYLIGRPALEAMYLVQGMAADEGISHAIAAVQALEQTGRLPVARNGELLRELLHGLSVLHAHLRHMYLGALPDYLPWGAVTALGADHPDGAQLARAMESTPEQHWTRLGFEHPFNAEQVARLAQNQWRAVATMGTLQQAMAAIGGKYPMTMCLMPGGVTTPLDAALVHRLRVLLQEARPFLLLDPLDDGLLLVQGYPALRELGAAPGRFLAAGGVGGDTEAFPAGVQITGLAGALEGMVTEDITHARYTVGDTLENGQPWRPAPDKADAYSWVKAARYEGQAMETGPHARLAVAHGPTQQGEELPAWLQQVLQGSPQPLTAGSSVGSRLMARVGEIGPLVRHLEALVESLEPDQPAMQWERAATALTGEATVRLEAPAGMIQHRVVLEQGTITGYDIIGASTWNGAAQDDSAQAGPLESALNAAQPDLTTAAGLRQASRILHSFAFSVTDGVQ